MFVSGTVKNVVVVVVVATAVHVSIVTTIDEIKNDNSKRVKQAILIWGDDEQTKTILI